MTWRSSAGLRCHFLQSSLFPRQGHLMFTPIEWRRGKRRNESKSTKIVRWGKMRTELQSHVLMVRGAKQTPSFHQRMLFAGSPVQALQPVSNEKQHSMHFTCTILGHTTRERRCTPEVQFVSQMFRANLLLCQECINTHSCFQIRAEIFCKFKK